LVYLKLDDAQNRQTLAGNITRLLREKRFSHLEYLLPDEYRLDRHLRQLAEKLPATCRAVDTQHFLTERRELEEFFAGKKRYLMESFYRRMRRQYDILMERDKPAGGKWNYDQKNRKAYDPKVPIPRPLLFKNDVSDITRTLQKKKVATIGQIKPA